MQQMEIWLVILFLSRKKFHAKQIFVLSSSMKLGPGVLTFITRQSGKTLHSTHIAAMQEHSQ